MHFNVLLIISILVSHIILHGMEENSNYVIYAIPGKNGRGSETKYIKETLGWKGDVVQVKTPYLMQDLGQYFCQRDLVDALKNEHRNIIFYATSQGTATVLNYVANQENNSKIKAIIWEGGLASGNSAIYHTVTGELMNMPWVKKIPGSYYFVPYLAITECLGYRPGGQQPIWSIDTIKKDIPIIIIHSKNDPQCPFYGACALYYRLRENGKRNVYLIENSLTTDHIQILSNKYYLQSAVRTILQKHLPEISLNPIHNTSQIFSENTPTVPLPNHNLYKNCYIDLVRKEKVIHYFEYGAFVTALVYCALKL